MNRALVVSLIFLVIFGGAALAETITITVHDYPAGDGPSDFVSAGIPFKPGALFDDTTIRRFVAITRAKVPSTNV